MNSFERNSIEKVVSGIWQHAVDQSEISELFSDLSMAVMDMTPNKDFGVAFPLRMSAASSR
jgi:hypothetical protein